MKECKAAHDGMWSEVWCVDVCQCDGRGLSSYYSEI
jgi:hypothetical protein